jgi:hypothetical protein
MKRILVTAYGCRVNQWSSESRSKLQYTGRNISEVLTRCSWLWLYLNLKKKTSCSSKFARMYDMILVHSSYRGRGRSSGIPTAIAKHPWASTIT